MHDDKIASAIDSSIVTHIFDNTTLFNYILTITQYPLNSRDSTENLSLYQERAIAHQLIAANVRNKISRNTHKSTNVDYVRSGALHAQTER